MKLPWRYAICLILLTVGIVVGYNWCQKSTPPKELWKLKEHVHHHQRTLSVQGRPEVENPNTGKEADSLICDEKNADCHETRHDNWKPFLNCAQIAEVTLEKKIGEGLVKQVFLGRWQEMRLAYANLSHPRYLEDFLHGAEMLQAMHVSKHVVQLLGSCLDANPPVILTEYHELGSAETIEDIFSQQLGLADSNTLRTRFHLCLDYARILSFLHSSPVGTRIMCDSNDPTKTLSQFLVTNDLRLVINDLDALPLVDRTRGLLAKCGHRQLFDDFVAPEQLWPFQDKAFQDEEMPPYDEKTDIWKVPDITDLLLGKVDHSDIVRLHLFKLHKQCKERDPSLRPTAKEILAKYQEIFDSIVSDSD
ncbi:protein O-mannose kinase-like [Asterias amurensis]|uniref:protein O-mannose kinase-like n=1 Tax=Asterias amurensis TaxID=7602 RepID=UPI003AB4B442